MNMIKMPPDHKISFPPFNSLVVEKNIFLRVLPNQLSEGYEKELTLKPYFLLSISPWFPVNSEKMKNQKRDENLIFKIILKSLKKTIGYSRHKLSRKSCWTLECNDVVLWCWRRTRIHSQSNLSPTLPYKNPIKFHITRSNSNHFRLMKSEIQCSP